ncbi:MAG: alcohol dehydrogenase catalytic domain-containing protein [Propionibacteriaceae bacterium]|nr:alcohol dehydrogenase catalytic domain-containing protein [Propionibacteriaceae bacterium]
MNERTMTAVIKRAAGPAGIEVDTIPRPRPEQGQAVLTVIATGICGTDVHIAHDEYAHETPVVMGHEILGRVRSVGSPVDEHWLGRLVAAETYFATCETCHMCRAGRRNLCGERKSLGSYRDGGFADEVLLPVINLHALPVLPGALDGVLSEPLACVTHCLLDPAVVQPGDQVLVTGPGTMGQLAAQVARASGGHVTLSGLPSDAERLSVAREIGFDTITSVPTQDVFDVVIECSGSGAAAAVALQSVRRGGRYVQVGIFGKDVSVPLDLVIYKEVIVTSGFASTPTSWRSAIRLLESGELSLSPLVTREVTLLDFGDALAAAERGEGLKTVVRPGSPPAGRRP